jgi:hypothetical protein
MNTATGGVVRSGGLRGRPGICAGSLYDNAPSAMLEIPRRVYGRDSCSAAFQVHRKWSVPRVTAGAHFVQAVHLE